MQVNEIMTAEVEGIASHESALQAAQQMARRDVGALPVFENGQPIGMVTDRDITVRAVAEGKNPAETPVGTIATRDLLMVPQDTELGEAVKLMEERQVRRLLVSDTEGRIVGIISLADLATRSEDEALSAEVVTCVSQPA